MKTKRELNSDDAPSNIRLIRPLLVWAGREDTVKFCEFNKIEFRQDAMNDDLYFRRVRIRREVLPLLAQLNPNIIETLARTANLIELDAEILRGTAREKLNAGEDFLRVGFLKKLPPNLLTARAARMAARLARTFARLGNEAFYGD